MTNDTLTTQGRILRLATPPVLYTDAATGNCSHNYVHYWDKKTGAEYWQCSRCGHTLR